jgi:hypothetical protein
VRILACIALLAASIEAGAQAPAILKAFNQDLAVCQSIARAMKDDRPLVESFREQENPQPHRFEMLLRDSPNAASPDFQYVLANAAYFDIDISMHGNPWAVAWVEDAGIYCAPTLARLREIEALGESEPAWTLRQYFLDRALRNLDHPSDEMLSGSIDFEQFRSIVTETDRAYPRAERPKFLAWLREAIKTVEAGRGRIQDGAAGRSADEQSNILDDRVRFLRSVLEG